VLETHYDLYSNWYHNTIRELVTIVDFGEDYAMLGKMLTPTISARQAKASVNLLLNLGFLEKTAEGYRQTDTAITTGDEVRSLAIQNFHLQNMRIASESIERCPANERDISSLVTGLSKKGFENVKKEIQLFRKRLVDIIDTDLPAERVYHINFQLFPTSVDKKTEVCS